MQFRVDLPLDFGYRREQLFQPFGGQILRLDGDYDPVGGGQRVDGEHTQGGLAVYEDMGILPLYTVQILPQNRFPAHSVYQRHLHAGQLNIRRHQVHALRVAQNPLAGADRLIGQDAAHCVREGKGQLIRLGIAQADGQAPLRVPVNEKHFLSGLRQSNP